MYGRPDETTIQAFTREVSREVNAAVERVAAKYGFSGQVLVIDGQNSIPENAVEALQTLAEIRALVN